MRLWPFWIGIEEVQEETNVVILTRYRWWRPSDAAVVTFTIDPAYGPQFYWEGTNTRVDYPRDAACWRKLHAWHKAKKEKEEQEKERQRHEQHQKALKIAFKPVKKPAELPAELPEARVLEKGDT